VISPLAFDEAPRAGPVLGRWAALGTAVAATRVVAMSIGA